MSKFMTKMEIYAGLPFVELAKEGQITLGPVNFWPSSDFKTHLPPSLQKPFAEYLETMSTIKTFGQTDNKKPITTLKLRTPSIACVSIETSINPRLKEPLLIDALYLLYFAASFRNVYYNDEIIPFKAFTKILPAKPEFITEKSYWEKMFIGEAKREDIACITWMDEEICKALGEALRKSYKAGDENDHAIRLIRSIRFFVDRFFSKFENVFALGLEFHPKIFEPEDTLFLSSSFDVLLNIDEKHPASDFRHKVRPMLHLKYSKPVELFWKWVDAFYLLKKQVIHGSPDPVDLFRENPNFQVPLLHIGVKLFIYAIYYQLFKDHLVHSERSSPFTPPDFKFIHPEEILLFFWTEESLLRKISALLMQIKGGKQSKENEMDIALLSSTYSSLLERFHLGEGEPPALFLKTPSESLEHYLNNIQQYGQGYLPPNFLTLLK